MMKLLGSIWRYVAFLSAGFACIMLSAILVAVNVAMLWNLYKELSESNWQFIINGDWEQLLRGLISVAFLGMFFAIASILLYRAGKKLWQGNIVGITLVKALRGFTLRVIGAFAQRSSLFRKLIRRIAGLLVFCAGIFCFMLGLFILAALLPKVWAVFNEIYHGDLKILFLKGDWLTLLSMVVLPVVGTSVILFALGFRLIKHNYVSIILQRWLRARMS